MVNRYRQITFAFYTSGLLAIMGLVGSGNINGKKISVPIAAITSGVTKDEWKGVGAGGGGAMFNPEVSPFNPGYAFVSCDMTGSYFTYDGGESWRTFNLHSPVNFYVFDPLDSNTVYANSLALFKSNDRGLTWNLLYPSPSETIGLVARGDHAEEILVTRDSTIRQVQALAVDPGNSKKLFAVISIDQITGLYLSDNGGQKWKKEKELVERAKNIFIDPGSSKDDRTIYITGSKGLMVRSKGKWENHGSPTGVKTLTHFTAGFDKENKRFIIYAISGKSYFNPETDSSGIYYSDDGGVSWQNRQDGIMAFSLKSSNAPEWRTVATSLTHPDVVYVSYSNLKSNGDTTFIGVAKSEDFGKTWALSWKDVLKKNGNVASINFKGGWINDRYGPTWGENPFSIGVSPANPDVCYATDFGRTVKTADGGKTWEQVYTTKNQGGWTTKGLDVTTGYLILWDPFDKNHVFTCNTDIGLTESKDGGISWQSATKNNGVPHRWENSSYWLAFDPDVKGRAWAAMSDVHDLPRPKMFRIKGVKGYKGGILVTEDAGLSWRPVSDDIGEAAITHVLIDPFSNKVARTLYACAFGKGVYKSVDGGKSWKQKNQGIAGDEPFAWRIFSRGSDRALFLVVNRRSEDGSIGNAGDGAIYRSDDGAETWKPVPLPDQTNGPMSLIADEENGDRLLLSAWGRNTRGKFSPDIGGGIFLSKNNGKSWVPVLRNDQHIHDITYDPRNKFYYACGFTGAAYKSEDKGETWLPVKGYDFKWGKRVDMDPSDPGKIFIITFGGGVWHGPSRTEGGDGPSFRQIVSHGY